MMLLLAMLAGFSLAGQEAGPPAEPATPLPAVEVIAPPNEGAVTLECRIQSNGSLRDCVIISVTPAGQGFGEAALDGARRARLDRRALDRSAPGDRIRFTTRFRLAE